MQPSQVMPSMVSVTVVGVAGGSAHPRWFAPAVSIRVRRAAARRRVIMAGVYTDFARLSGRPRWTPPWASIGSGRIGPKWRAIPASVSSEQILTETPAEARIIALRETFRRASRAEANQRTCAMKKHLTAVGLIVGLLVLVPY
jgi:hypothetical protein